MSYYTTIRCKCIVKQEYRPLMEDILSKVPTQVASITAPYIKQILSDGGQFICFFLGNLSGWHEAIPEENIPFSFDPHTGHWQFHATINREFGEIKEFLVRFNPRFLEQVYYLEIYDENSVNHYLEGRWNDYLTTDFWLKDLVYEFKEIWCENIFLS